MRHQGIALSKSDILDGVWAASTPRGSGNTVEIYIGYRRRKIDIPFGTNTIRTIRSVGYRLDSGAFATGS